MQNTITKDLNTLKYIYSSDIFFTDSNINNLKTKISSLVHVVVPCLPPIYNNNDNDQIIIRLAFGQWAC